MFMKGEMTASVCRLNTDKQWIQTAEWVINVFRVNKKAFFYCSNKTVGQFVCIRSLYFVSRIPSKHPEYSTVDICSLTNMSLLVIVVIYLADPAVSLRYLPMPLKAKETLILLGTGSRFGHSTCPWAKTKLRRRLMLRALFWLHDGASRQGRKSLWAALRWKVYLSILNC